MARVQRWGRLVAGCLLLAAAAWWVARHVDSSTWSATSAALRGAPLALGLGFAGYAVALALRSFAWCALQPGLRPGAAWSGVHVGLLGNHVLPLRLGEALRPTTTARRTGLPLRDVAASTVTARLLDVATLLTLVLAGYALLPHREQGIAAPGGVPGTLVLLALLAVAVLASRPLLRRFRLALPRPGAAAVTLTALAWPLEAALLLAVAEGAGVDLGVADAVAVTAVTVLAQTLALTPGGVGSYEAAAGAGLVAAGVPAGQALAVALATHAAKTGYALVTGAVALVVPGPGVWGRLRLPRPAPSRPPALRPEPHAPLVVVVPAHDEEATVATLVARVPRALRGHRVEVVVVDDGSADATAAVAAAAGATVVRHERNRGLGAAVRTALATASTRSPAAVVYLDADLEYDPAEIESVAGPVLAGRADYVVGSRFAGHPRRMRVHRMAGNRLLTAWLRFTARRHDITDGQSGFRAFSAAAAAEAEIVHDYNYAQVLTLDLLAKGFRYAEVPISYAFRQHGRSFVRPGRYLRFVVPAVYREVNRTASVLDDVLGMPGASREPGRTVDATVG